MEGEFTKESLKDTSVKNLRKDVLEYILKKDFPDVLIENGKIKFKNGMNGTNQEFYHIVHTDISNDEFANDIDDLIKRKQSEQQSGFFKIDPDARIIHPDISNAEIVKDIDDLIKRKQSERQSGFFKIDPDAQIPTRGTPNSVGWDLYALKDYELTPFKTELIQTGIGVKIPSGCYARIAPRSGLSVKGLIVNAGVVDRDYRDELKVIVFCVDSPMTIKKGNRIAQLILEKVDYTDMPCIINESNDKSTHSGFGSTGN